MEEGYEQTEEGAGMMETGGVVEEGGGGGEGEIKGVGGKGRRDGVMRGEDERGEKRER